MSRLCVIILLGLLSIGQANAEWMFRKSVDPFTKSTTHAAAVQSTVGTAMFTCELPKTFGFAFQPASPVAAQSNREPFQIISLLIVVDGGDVHRFVLSLPVRRALSEGLILLPGAQATDAAWLVAAATKEVGFALEVGNVVQHRMVVSAGNAKSAVYEALSSCGLN
jgi:ribosomal protein S11